MENDSDTAGTVPARESTVHKGKSLPKEGPSQYQNEETADHASKAARLDRDGPADEWLPRLVAARAKHWKEHEDALIEQENYVLKRMWRAK